MSEIRPDTTPGWREATFTIPADAPAGSEIRFSDLADGYVDIYLEAPSGEQIALGRARTWIGVAGDYPTWDDISR